MIAAPTKQDTFLLHLARKVLNKSCLKITFKKMKAQFNRCKPWMPYIFWLGMIATILVTLLPSHQIPRAVIFWDKAQHTLAFFLLMLTGCLAYPHKVRTLFVALIAYGIAIEYMQRFFTATRSGDIHDVVADVTGIMIGWLIFLVINRTIGKP